MKVIIDMNLSPKWVQVFEQQGWHAVHWRMVSEPPAADETIMAWAREHGYVVFTRDLDFGAILATTHVQGPSVIQIRDENMMPHHLGDWLAGVLRQHEAELVSGALLTVHKDRVRIRALPFPGGL